MSLTHTFILDRPLPMRVVLTATAVIAVVTLVALFGLAGLLGASVGFLPFLV